MYSEVGTGTGYNAALLGALCGPSGVVVTIELEPDLARTQQRRSWPTSVLTKSKWSSATDVMAIRRRNRTTA